MTNNKVYRKHSGVAVIINNNKNTGYQSFLISEKSCDKSQFIF